MGKEKPTKTGHSFLRQPRNFKAEFERKLIVDNPKKVCVRRKAAAWTRGTLRRLFVKEGVVLTVDEVVAFTATLAFTSMPTRPFVIKTFSKNCSGGVFPQRSWAKRVTSPQEGKTSSSNPS